MPAGAGKLWMRLSRSSRKSEIMFLLILFWRPFPNHNIIKKVATSSCFYLVSIGQQSQGDLDKRLVIDIMYV
jgi:hypothetical protein